MEMLINNLYRRTSKMHWRRLSKAFALNDDPTRNTQTANVIRPGSKTLGRVFDVRNRGWRVLLAGEIE